MLLDVRVLLTHPYGCVDYGVRVSEDLRRDHHVDAENAALVLDQVVGPFQQLFHDGGYVVVVVRTGGAYKGFVDPGLEILVKDAAGGKQPQDAGVGRSNSQVVVSERSHACLDDGILDPDQVTQSRSDHRSSFVCFIVIFFRYQQRSLADSWLCPPPRPAPASCQKVSKASICGRAANGCWGPTVLVDR